MEHPRLCVTIPTKNRPEKLERCLTALAAARGDLAFTAHVCDSSDADVRPKIRSIVDRIPFAELYEHDGRTVTEARNTCTWAADAPLIVSVDDDVRVRPGSIEQLLAEYDRRSPYTVVAGSVRWGDEWSRPVKMRPIGYGRAAEPGEAPDFLVSAFLLYPRDLAVQLPWNESLSSSEDRFAGAVWRAAGVTLAFASEARADHDDEHNSYGVHHMANHAYANLADAWLNYRWRRLISYEIAGLAYGLKKFKAQPRQFLAAWVRGHAALWRDRSKLAELRRRTDSPAPHGYATATERVQVARR